jgi:hypothetical protein
LHLGNEPKVVKNSSGLAEIWTGTSGPESSLLTTKLLSRVNNIYRHACRNIEQGAPYSWKGSGSKGGGGIGAEL